MRAGLLTSDFRLLTSRGRDEHEPRTRGTISGERGVVLVAVLWTFVFLFVVALEFSAAVREEGSAAARFAQETEGYYMALAAFHQGLYDTLASFSQPGPAASSRVGLLFDERCREGALGEGVYRFCLEDEGGKISLNGADDLTLRQIFSHLDIEPAQRDILVDSILDWRDADELHRINGAESDYYLSLSIPYKAKNAPFDTVEELLWIRGMTPELFYGDQQNTGLRKVFTVDNPANRLNLRTASAEAIRLFLGLSREQAERFVEERDKLSEKTLADVIRLLGLSAEETMARRLAFTIPVIVTIEASGYATPSSPVRKLKGVVRLGSGGSGFQLIRWLDRET